MSGDEDVSEYRRHAAICTDAALRTSDQQAKVELFKMALGWTRLAEQAEKNATAPRNLAQQQH